MILKLYDWYQEMRSSFWFVPAVIVFGAVGLAAVLIAIDATVDLPFVERWPLLFGAGASGARGRSGWTVSRIARRTASATGS